MVIKKKKRIPPRAKPVSGRYIKKRYRATARGKPVMQVKSDEVTLIEIEKDLLEARTLLYLILAVTLGLFGLMLGITVKLFM